MAHFLTKILADTATKFMVWKCVYKAQTFKLVHWYYYMPKDAMINKMQKCDSVISNTWFIDL